MHTMKPPVNVWQGQGALGKTFYASQQTGTAQVDDDSVASLLAQGWTDVTPDSYVTAHKDLTGGIDFSGMLMGNLANGSWFNPPSLFRLLLNGTGTVTLDSKDAAGNITTGVYSTALSNAVNQIDFPYAGDGTIQIRATLTGTATAKVI